MGGLDKIISEKIIIKNGDTIPGREWPPIMCGTKKSDVHCIG